MEVKGDLTVRGDLRGINFTDGVSTFSKQPKLTFDQSGFYLTPTSDGSPKVNARGVTFTDGTANFINPKKEGFSNDFYLAGSLNPVVNIRNPVFKSITLEFPGAAENILVYRAH